MRATYKLGRDVITEFEAQNAGNSISGVQISKNFPVGGMPGIGMSHAQGMRLDPRLEMTLIRVNQPVHNLHIVAIYRSTSKVKIARFINALKHLHSTFLSDSNVPVIILGDFNVNLNKNASDKNTLSKYLIEEKKYVQLITQVTTDYKTRIDHIYTDIPERVKNSGVLESYFSDHKPIFVSLI